MLGRHVRWCLRCVDCHEYIDRGPVPSKPSRVPLKRKRALAKLREQAATDNCLIDEDFKKSGMEWDDYYEELYECEVLDMRGEWDDAGP